MLTDTVSSMWPGAQRELSKADFDLTTIRNGKYDAYHVKLIVPFISGKKKFQLKFEISFSTKSV